MTTAQFRTKCREYAESYIEKMTGQFQRLGVLGEWENPYITLLPEFEAKQIEVFGKMAEKGLIYKGMKPVYWCPFDQMCIRDSSCRERLKFVPSDSPPIFDRTVNSISIIHCPFGQCQGGFMATFAERLLLLREEKHVSQSVAANASGINPVSYTHLPLPAWVL